jgi:HD-GYP domain-containing protein (c-di-GMP phosphodiesterase class II)
VTTPGLSGADRIERSLTKLAERVDSLMHHGAGHSWRIALACERLARRFHLQDEELTDVRHAALARGYGYTVLRLDALERPGPLTDGERVELWRHPLLAEQHLARRGVSRYVQLVVRWHHEWWNGLGYPDMLAGDSIPAGARLLRAAETYFALRTDRPHRAAFDVSTARQILASRSGIELDPRVAAALLELLEAEPTLETAVPDVPVTPRLTPIPAPEVRQEGT